MLERTPTPTNPDPLLTVKQAEGYAGLSASLFRRRIADGSLPVVRFGARAVRIRRSTLDAYLAAGDR
jgi:excisionase family DNA binding protein